MNKILVIQNIELKVKLKNRWLENGKNQLIILKKLIIKIKPISLILKILTPNKSIGAWEKFF